MCDLLSGVTTVHSVKSYTSGNGTCTYIHARPVPGMLEDIQRALLRVEDAEGETVAAS